MAVATTSTDDGELTWEEFVRCAEEILKISNEISDGWEIVRATTTTNNDPGSLYLRKKCFITISRKADINDGSTTDAANTTTTIAEIPHDPSSKIIHNQQQHENKDEILSFEYHVIYNLAYAVPVIFFNAHKSNGTLLRVEDAWGLFDESYKTIDMQSTLTQMEHPILFRPFLTLHPCRTNEFLRIMNERFVYLLFLLNSIQLDVCFFLVLGFGFDDVIIVF